MSEDKTRALPVRWYIDGKDLVGRATSKPDERFPLEALPEYVAVEGYVHLRSKGHNHRDIITAQCRPDRSLPTSRTGEVSDLSKWREAIAWAFAGEITKPGFVGVTREAKDAALAEGRGYAANLSRSDVRDFATRSSVLIEYNKLYGDRTPLRKPNPAQEAAD